MKIIIDGTIYSTAPTGGVFRYLNELIPRLSKFAYLEVNIFTPKNAVATPMGVNINVLSDNLPTGSWIAEGPVKNLLRKTKQTLQSYVLQARLSGLNDSLFHSVSYTQCPWPSQPQVVTIHDMISEIFPETFDLPHTKILREKKSECLRTASRVVAVSEQTKKDLQSIYSVPASKIDVIYHGVDNLFFSKVETVEFQKQFLKSKKIASPYFLFLGGRLHHKNFPRFLKAFAMSKVSKNYDLVIAGLPWFEGELELVQSLNLKDKIVFMDMVKESELPTLYQNATAFAFPSYYEGFGFPLVEAMAAGCPVVASNTGPFPELSQGAALLFDPYDEANMSQALERILDPVTKRRCVETGKIQAAKFSWDESARQHFETYKKTLKEL